MFKKYFISLKIMPLKKREENTEGTPILFPPAKKEKKELSDIVAIPTDIKERPNLYPPEIDEIRSDSEKDYSGKDNNYSNACSDK